MYEDSWYSFVPEVHGKQDDGHLQKSQHRRRESLLKQPNDSDNAATGRSGPLDDLLEEPSSVNSPPPAMVARRAKSYSDFYHVARAQLLKDSKKIREKEREPRSSKGSIKIGAEFENMYESHEDELLHASLEEFEIYKDQLALSIRHLNGLLQNTSSALDILAGLSGSFKSVEAQTMVFQGQCEDLLEEQKQIKSLSAEVGDGLQYYAYLEPITRRLNAPGVSSVIGDEGYLEIMTNLDACIEFMIKHPDHRESDLYLTRYQSLLARVLSLIGNMFAKSVESSAAAAKRAEAERRRIAGDVLTITSVYIYQAPDSVAEVEHYKESLKHIVEQADRAIKSNTPQKTVQNLSAFRSYLSIYEDQLTTLTHGYIKTRSSVIPNFVEILLSKTIADDINPKSETFRYTRECANSILEICAIETTKFLNIFSENWGQLRYQDGPSPLLMSIEKGAFRYYLAGIVKLTYDVLLPHIKQVELPAVVDLAMYLNGQAYYRTINDDVVSTHSDEEEEMTNDIPTRAKAQVAGQLNQMFVHHIFGWVKEIVLRDVEKYTPTSNDLAFPAGTHGGSDAKSKTWSDKFTEDAHGARLEKALGPGILEAYAPLGTASRLLLIVHDLTFEYGGENGSTEVAYEILHRTCTAITRAADLVTGKSSQIDGRIFAIKNLVLLKNLVLAFEIAGSRRASVLDFTDLWATFAELRSRGGLFDLTSYYRLLTSGTLLPKVVESVQDARIELDGLLRENITLLCEEGAALIVKDFSGGKRGTLSADEQIRKKLSQAFPSEDQLRETLYEAIKAQITLQKERV